MTRAILHLLLLIMLFQDVVYSVILICVPNDSCLCEPTGNIAQWRISCGPIEKINLTVTLHHYKRSAAVQCRGMDTWPLFVRKMFNFSELISTVIFDHCPLPKWPLSNVIGDVENETTKKLEIRALTSTMSKVTRGNFLRFQRIAELLLFSSGVVEFSADALQDLSDLRRISFEHNNISVLPPELFKGLAKLEELYLNDNKMQRVNSLLFENLSELKFLSLSDNHLESLELGTFKDLVNLIDLNIGNNYLTTLPKDIFEPLAKLEVLEMSDNEFFSLPQELLVGNSGLVIVQFSNNRGNLSTLPDKFFGNLTFLGDVNVARNNFTDLPEDIFVGCPRVKLIDLSKNKLSKLRENTFKNLTSISMIDLSDNELNNLPAGLFESRASLSHIDLQNNAITSISRNLLSNAIDWQIVKFDFNQISEIESWTFSNFTKLHDVSLKKNKLKNLPENIFWGSFGLRYLDMSQNTLTDLPVKLFRDSPNITDLNLDSNKLNNLPEGIFHGLGKLSNLHLQNNAFTMLPVEVLAQATSLRKLHFEFNRMTEFNIGHLWCLPMIEVASFSHNLITRTISSTSSYSDMLDCTENSKLTDLALDNNKIIVFPWYEMPGFAKLSRLNLTYNQISSVALSNLDFLNKVVHVDITRNNVTKLADIDNIPPNSLVRLHIGDNPIDCGCAVYDLRKYFVDRLPFKFNIAPDHLTCSKPVSMVGRPLENLKLETFECELDDRGEPRICPKECSCTRRPFDDTLVANCSYRNLTEAPYEFDGFKGRAIELNLTGNSITEMSFFHEHSWREYKYEKVTMIILSGNSIENVTFDFVPENLRVLHLDNNNLTRFHVAVAETVKNSTSLQNITLHSNPWSCDRETRMAFIILKEKLDRKIRDAFGKTCLDSRHNKNGDVEPQTYITYRVF